MGGRMTAPVITRPAAREWRRERLSRFECPTEAGFVQDPARTAAGKINAKQLRAPSWANA